MVEFEANNTSNHRDDLRELRVYDRTQFEAAGWCNHSCS